MKIINRLLPALVLMALASVPARAADKTIDFVEELNFYNTDLSLVLTAMRERTGYSFVEDIPVQGKVTVHISKKTPIPEILDQILRGLNLSWRLVGGVYHINLKMPVKGAPLGKGLLAKTYELTNVPADEAAEAVRALLSEYGKVTVDLGLNTITVTDIGEVHANAKVKLDGVDVPDKRPAQINIRAKILEIETIDTKSSEAMLNWNKYNANEGIASDFVGNNLTDALDTFSNGLTFKVGHFGIDQFVAWFSMYHDTSTINILAEPDVTVPPGKEATIEVGDKLAQVWGSSFSWQQTGVILQVKPGKPNDKTGMIEIDIKRAEIRELSGRMDTALFIDYLNMRKVATVVEVVSGGTIRVGGLSFEEDMLTESKVPILGDLPLFGILFKSSSKVKTKREIVILISPRVLERIPPRCATTAGISALSANLLAGTTAVMLDWSEDVPFDNIGVVRYHVYRDIRPILNTMNLIPISREVRGDVTSWVDYTPKRRGVTYYYAVTGIDGADNEQAVSNSPAVTIPRR